jgi:hypothetical protein
MYVITTWGESSRRRRTGSVVRRGMGALAALALLSLGLSGPALASDLVTLNNTNAYVDPGISQEFMTVPNLCLEPVDSQGTTTGCDELGLRAVLAIQDNSPYGDHYWESEVGTVLFDTASFVPSNPGGTTYGEFSGFSPIFSMHKYDLFGRGDEYMGPYTRAENLLLAIAFPADGTVPATDPGGGNVGPVAVGYARTIILSVLAEHDGVTTVDFGGLTFELDDLPTFERITGIPDGGKLDTIWAFCVSDIAGGPGILADLLCGPDADTPGSLPFSTIADLWIATSGLFTTDQIDAYLPDPCGGADGTVSTANCDNHDEWIDQIVTGYVEAWASLGGDDHFAQNFRSQMDFDQTVPLTIGTGRIVDQRIEQSAELSGAFTSVGSDPGDLITPGDNQDFIAGRQTFQQAIQSLGGVASQIGQLTSQDVMGFLLECMNCDQLPDGNMHAFTPAELSLYYQPYVGGWNVVPTIVHGGS